LESLGPLSTECFKFKNHIRNSFPPSGKPGGKGTLTPTQTNRGIKSSPLGGQWGDLFQLISVDGVITKLQRVIFLSSIHCKRSVLKYYLQTHFLLRVRGGREVDEKGNYSNRKLLFNSKRPSYRVPPLEGADGGGEEKTVSQGGRPARSGGRQDCRHHSLRREMEQRAKDRK